MSNRFLTEQFARWRDAGEELVLVTVAETAGSTYSKTGRQLLINRAHKYSGLVGGGCLEGDLVLRADEVFADGVARTVTYDMRDDADDLWGMGLGCRGLMKLVLQKLSSGNHWQPFADISLQMQANHPSTCSLDVPGETQPISWQITPWPRLLVLGAGPDAAPVVNLARTLGWQVSVADHRDELLQSAELDQADERYCAAADDIASTLCLDDYTAVCVMSHHLPSDRAYLRALAEHEHAYAGVLGPAARRDELLGQLDLRDSAFAHRLHGPVGLEIGADTPQSIALALIAQIQAVIANTGDTR